IVAFGHLVIATFNDQINAQITKCPNAKIHSSHGDSDMRQLFFATLVSLIASSAAAQLPNPYGTSINVADAKKIAALSVAEANKNNWKMAIAIVDISGDLVYFEKIDGTQAASVQIAQDKARSAARFKRPT